MTFTHTYLLGQLCKILKPLMIKDTDVVYIGLLKTTSLCTFVVNKSHRSTEVVFLHFQIVCYPGSEPSSLRHFPVRPCVFPCPLCLKALSG